MSPSAPTVSTVFQFLDGSLCKVLQPRRVRKHGGLGSAPFARHYSGYRYFLSLPPGTKMFQFPGFALPHGSTWPSAMWVAPFGCSRIKSCLQIPATFRSLPRPSSPPDSLGILRSLFLPFSNESRAASHDPSGPSKRTLNFFALAYEIAVPNFYEKTHILLQTIFTSILLLPLNLFSQYCQ